MIGNSGLEESEAGMGTGGDILVKWTILDIVSEITQAESLRRRT
jgi:hypothetical protein